MIYVFLAQGFEEIEALSVVDILRRAELNVQTVGVGNSVVTGAHGIAVVCDVQQEDISPKELQMLVLPGGMPGTLHLEKSPIVQEMIDFAVQNDIWLAAICAAPSILGHKGLLDGKEAVCFPGFEQQMGKAHLSQKSVVQAGKIITAKGAGVAVDFALKLVECLQDTPRAELLRSSLQCQN